MAEPDPGVSANLTFGQYFAHPLEVLSGRFTPEDIYLGSLLSAYEALDSGTTTVLDWSHALNTPAHAAAAVFLAEPSAALVQSAHPGNIHTVLVAGRIVKRNRCLVGVSLAELRRKARRANQRLLREP